MPRTLTLAALVAFALVGCQAGYREAKKLDEEASREAIEEALEALEALEAARFEDRETFYAAAGAARKVFHAAFDAYERGAGWRTRRHRRFRTLYAREAWVAVEAVYAARHTGDTYDILVGFYVAYELVGPAYEVSPARSWTEDKNLGAARRAARSAARDAEESIRESIRSSQPTAFEVLWP